MLLPVLLLEILHSVFLVGEGGRSERQSARYTHVAQGHQDDTVGIRGRDVAHDATLVAGLRDIGDGLDGVDGHRPLLSGETGDQFRHQADLERQRLLHGAVCGLIGRCLCRHLGFLC
ncbi:MAG: hypothetical protein APF80_10120 [Alphaproteobacteria bacterium BRH_c36]|nr:MAG: hypothetical protein APF80_10120 [Alphaproteobacteria bacterium BRH_c36]